MAFKRTTKKTGPHTRRSTTIHSNGSHATNSTSVKSGNMTMTYTQKGSKSYTTQTIRRADGFVERKRVHSNAIKKLPDSEIWDFLFGIKKKRRTRQKSSAFTTIILTMITSFFVFAYLFG